MGSVWKAHDGEMDRIVAIKVAGSECLRDPTFRERFRREVRNLIRLEHPHIVRLYDMGEEDGIPFAVLAYIEGGNLRERVERLGHGEPRRLLSVADVATWVGPLADALDFIHERGVVHRDVKPENLLFDLGGHPYLADFGISKASGREQSLTPDQFLVGTAHYVAPEAIREEPLSGAFDQYGLATVVFEVLAGAPPFGGSLGTLLRRKALEEAPPIEAVAERVEIPGTVSAALARALARDPAVRFPTCAAFVEALLPR